MPTGTVLEPKGAIYGGDLCKVFIYSDLFLHMPSWAVQGRPF